MTGRIKTTTRQLCVRVETRLRNMGVLYDYIQNANQPWERLYVIQDITHANKNAWAHMRSMFGTDVEFSEEDE